MRRVLLVVVLALLLLAPAGALAQQDLALPQDQGVAPTAPGTDQVTLVDEAAAALEIDDVWVSPDNGAGVSENEAAALRSAIRGQGGDILVAVFPPGVGEPETVGQALANEVRRNGTYVIVAGPDGRSVTAGTYGPNSGLAPGEASALATAVAGEHQGGDGGDLLLDLVADIGAARSDGTGAGGEEVDGSGALVLLGAIVLGAGAVLFFRTRSRRREQEAQLEELRQVADEDLIALGGDIRALDLDIEMPGVDERARDDYARALDAHRSASDALRQARRPEDFEPISHTLEEGRYAMVSAKARLEGREPPEHRPPCFFDPRHGPSTRDVEWAPAWGEPRLVPACEADAGRVEEGREPLAREIEVAGRGRTPYWNAPGYYGPYAGGFYGGFGGTGLLTGFLAGSLLTSMWAAPMAGAAGWGGDWGGDLGGGDWGGGGDFGGGFGGGDFGGGDF